MSEAEPEVGEKRVREVIYTPRAWEINDITSERLHDWCKSAVWKTDGSLIDFIHDMLLKIADSYSGEPHEFLMALTKNQECEIKMMIGKKSYLDTGKCVFKDKRSMCGTQYTVFTGERCENCGNSRRLRCRKNKFTTYFVSSAYIVHVTRFKYLSDFFSIAFLNEQVNMNTNSYAIHTQAVEEVVEFIKTVYKWMKDVCKQDDES